VCRCRRFGHLRHGGVAAAPTALHCCRASAISRWHELRYGHVCAINVVLAPAHPLLRGYGAAGVAAISLKPPERGLSVGRLPRYDAARQLTRRLTEDRASHLCFAVRRAAEPTERTTDERHLST
jgi:hypothetical protein